MASNIPPHPRFVHDELRLHGCRPSGYGLSPSIVLRHRAQVSRGFKLPSVRFRPFDLDSSLPKHVQSFYAFVPRPPCTSHVQPEYSGPTDQPVHPSFTRENENLTGCFADRPPSHILSTNPAPRARHVHPECFRPRLPPTLPPSAKMRTSPVVSQTVLRPTF